MRQGSHSWTADPLNSLGDSVSTDGSQFTSKPVEAHGIELASTTQHSKSPGDLNAVGNQDLPEHLQCMLPEENSLTESEIQRVKHLIREFDDIFTGPDGKVGYTHVVRHQINT